MTEAADNVRDRDLLIADDDSIFRERMARALRARGVRVRTAANHKDAMILAREESPEWAVVDLRMPGPGGLQLVHDLRTLDPATQIVVLTGYGSIATAVEAMRRGAQNYLPKPADADEVISAFAVEEPNLALEEDEKSVTSPSLARAEWEHIHRVLNDCEGNISEAARRLGIHRRSLQRKLKKHAPE